MASKKILCPVDYSECSRAALEYAFGLASKLGASLEVLHVWQVPREVTPGALITIPGLRGQPIEEFVEGEARREMIAFVALEGPQKPEVVSRLERGDAPSKIVERAQIGGFDLIVMGTHGRSGIAHALMGSVAEKVVRRATCPVLTYRGSQPGPARA